MKYTRIDIKGIEIVLVGDSDGITQLMVDNGTKPVEISSEWIESKELFVEAEKQLRAYFNGTRFTFDLKLNPQGTSFQKAVWSALEQIPYGKVCSYKDLAIRIGNPNASRAIGLANNRNPIPILIPCHRVIGADKKLVGYVFGLALKQRLLERERIARCFARFEDHYGLINQKDLSNRKSWWPAETVFEMMVGSILVQNTNWRNVDLALANLGEDLDPDFIDQLNVELLAEKIRPSGFHNQKAKKLKALCAWFKSYDYDVQKCMEKDTITLRKELLAINGVGNETADALLVYAFRKPSFVIDAYARRIFSRVGIDLPDKYEDFQALIEDCIPKEIGVYDYYHGLLVEHAKAFCQTKPLCASCPIFEFCERKEVAVQKSIIF